MSTTDGEEGPNGCGAIISFLLHTFSSLRIFLSRHAEVVVCSGSDASVTQRRGLSPPASELMRIHDYEITIFCAATSLTCAV
jgi:hypothetical protein